MNFLCVFFVDKYYYKLGNRCYKLEGRFFGCLVCWNKLDFGFLVVCFVM